MELAAGQSEMGWKVGFGAAYVATAGGARVEDDEDDDDEFLD